MKLEKKYFFVLLCWTIFLSTLSLLFCTAIANAENPCTEDVTAPSVTISAPTLEGHFETSSPAIDVSGYAYEECGIVMIRWSTDTSSGTIASGATSDWMNWTWHAPGIPLEEGQNLVTLHAMDAAGNDSYKNLLVTYTPPISPPEPPPGEYLEADNRKAKYTFYFQGYDNYDRGSGVAYLPKDLNGSFPMPFDQDVTIIVKFGGVDLPSFVQTIPAGTVEGTTKYRYVSGGPGLREVIFQDATSTSVYFYFFLDKWNYFPEQKDTMSNEEYIALCKSIDSYNLTVYVGSDRVYMGTAPLKPINFTSSKLELSYNR